MYWRVLIALLILMVMLLVSCGDDNEGEDNARSEPQETPTLNDEALAATAYAQRPSLTADAWTDTPTPNQTATISAMLAMWDTQTATVWTKTPTPTLTATPDWLSYATQGVSRNDEWEPWVQELNSVEMVLVPAGCFMMGSEDGDDDESPVHEQCFGQPFWIDRTEITRAMYQQCVDAGVCSETRDSNYSSRAEQPINRVTWYQAAEYCAWREVRLPTEREWEYAARGPDSLIYPWGNQFEADNVVYSINSSETAPVGSHPGGVSWVGAFDMSGNVWEWVSSGYADYPYNPNDGRETNGDYTYFSVRGGSFKFNAAVVRAANRSRDVPDDEDGDYGFRCAYSY